MANMGKSQVVGSRGKTIRPNGELWRPPESSMKAGTGDHGDPKGQDTHGCTKVHLVSLVLESKRLGIGAPVKGKIWWALSREATG